MPAYLQVRKEELDQRARDHMQALEDEQRRQEAASGLILLPEEERLRVLAGLQANLDSLNRDYGKLSLTVDTLPKITRYMINVTKLDTDANSYNYQETEYRKSARKARKCNREIQPHEHLREDCLGSGGSLLSIIYRTRAQAIAHPCHMSCNAVCYLFCIQCSFEIEVVSRSYFRSLVTLVFFDCPLMMAAAFAIAAYILHLVFRFFPFGTRYLRQRDHFYSIQQTPLQISRFLKFPTLDLVSRFSLLAFVCLFSSFV